MNKKSFIVSLLTLLSFFFIPFSSVVYPQFKTPVFENISIEDGLPENSVTCILQDYLGYLWLGTQNGLVRYDGYSMKIYQPENMNQEKLRLKGIVALYEDTEKTLWICTLNGLFKFNRSDESFKCYKNLDNDTGSINSDLVHCIYEDKKDRLWIGTQEGLNLFDRSMQKFTRYYFYPKDSVVITTSTSNSHNLAVNAITENSITGELLIGTGLEGLWKFNYTNKTFSKYKFSDIRIDKKIGRIQSFNLFKDKKIWMASYHKLCSLNPETGAFNLYLDIPVKEEERYWKPDFINSSVVKDYNGLIWCAFYAGAKGLFCLDSKTKRFQNYKLVPGENKNGYTNKLYMLYEDRSGILWIGTWGTGLWKWDGRKKKFLAANENLNSFKTLNNYFAYSFTYDPTGFVWLSTPRGLEKYDIKKGITYHYLQNETYLSQFIVYVTFLDKAGNIWLGTSNCGLIKFNPKDDSYHFYFNEPEKLGNKIIFTMFQDHFDFLWIGTDGFGLYKYDESKNKLTHYMHVPQDLSSLPGNRARVIFEDSFNTLWVGTDIGGLAKFDRRAEKFTYSGFGSVLSIYEDKNRNFWVGDYFTGLNLFDREKNKVIKCYDRKDGLASYSTWGILEDKQNNLWINTDNGLLKFSAETKRFKRYSRKDGLPDNFLSPLSPCMGPEGSMLFNTGKGLIIFNPDSIKDDQTPPNVVISNVSLFNRPGEKLNIEGFISEIKEITIPHYKNDLQFAYVGLQFSEPEKNSYKYILENFDKDWIDAGNQRKATYTNLEPGEYVFKVMAANRDGVWNKEAASLKIIITPPWWQTNLAYLFYALIFFSMLYFIRKIQLKRIRIKHEYEMSRFEAEKLHEVDELKSRFFTNISHEFRTPLTLIIGPVKQIIERTKDNKTKNELQIVHKNARSLLGLVNELLDISKLESGNMKLRTIPQNIIPLLKALVNSFCSYAERKRINLTFNCQDDEIIAYIDKEKIGKIITNILSNAFKFTPEGGKITAKAESSDKFFTLSISDTGVGIPKEKLPRIFDRFYHVDQAHTREYEGTGIGLTFTKELIELHKGTIEVESTEGKGTTFKINIPLGKEHLKPEEIFSNDDDKLLSTQTEPVVEEPIINNNYNFISENGKAVLLIVEDNYDVRNYIKQNLENNFNIIEACDGEEGWEKSIKQIPDLIISDVMMPKLDGFKLCDRLKSDERTSHIPVILLTAKASSQDKINGFKTGADDYIMKPFEPDELAERIKNLIEQRKRIHDYFRKHGLLELDDSNVSNLDKEFLDKVISTISGNMSSESFNVELLADKLFISRSLLHKKLVSLTGESPVELIRRMRLIKSTELMEKKFGNISQIALEVGFNNSAYFTECFKKQFGISPSQYLHKINKN